MQQMRMFNEDVPVANREAPGRLASLLKNPLLGLLPDSPPHRPLEGFRFCSLSPSSSVLSCRLTSAPSASQPCPAGPRATLGPLAHSSLPKLAL